MPGNCIQGMLDEYEADHHTGMDTMKSRKMQYPYSLDFDEYFLPQYVSFVSIQSYVQHIFCAMYLDA